MIKVKLKKFRDSQKQKRLGYLNFDMTLSTSLSGLPQLLSASTIFPQ